VTEDSEELFVPLVDADGRVTGVMDQLTADFLSSTDADPTQASLDAAFDGVTRVRLVGYRLEPTVVEYDGQPYEANEMVFDVVRLDVTDPASLAELGGVLRIVDADEYGHLLTIGEHHLELWVQDRHVHTLELLHGWDTIRWPSVWKGDGPLAEPRRLENWLLRHGITNARDHREEQERYDAEAPLRHREDWARAMPPSLRPLWPERLGDLEPDIGSARALLEAAIPDPIERVQALYEWFGSSSDWWSDSPAYEDVPQMLLLEFPIEVLFAALDASNDNVVALYGAAKFFAGRHFDRSRKRDRQRCPEPLVQRMLSAVQWYGYMGTAAAFHRAFDLPR
jgi:hypothetical protein